VTLAVRSPGAGERAAAEIVRSTGNPTARAARLDLTDRASVALFEAVVVSGNNGYRSGVATYALDEANADRLWSVSQQLLD
jgi:hypothetical protein